MTHRPLAAALWMGGSILSFTLMAVAGRAVAPVHDTFEIMMWRSALGFGLVILFAALTGRLREVRRDRQVRDGLGAGRAVVEDHQDAG